MSGLKSTLEPEHQVRRIEVFTGAGGRRRWTADDKARIVTETLQPGSVVSEVARRHGLSPQQLFTWRREARKRIKVAGDAMPAFVPAVVDEPRLPGRRQTLDAVAIEIEGSGVTVRIGTGARASTVVAVIRALKGTS